MNSKFKEQVTANIIIKLEELSFSLIDKTKHGVYIDRPNANMDNLLTNKASNPMSFVIIRGKSWNDIHSIRISVPTIIHIAMTYDVPVFDYIDTIGYLLHRQLEHVNPKRLYQAEGEYR